MPPVLLGRGLLRHVPSWVLPVGRADGVDGCAFYSWSSRASPRGSSVRVGRSSTALGRGLFRHVPSWFFLPAGASDCVDCILSCGFLRALFTKKRPCPASARVAGARDDRDEADLAAASHERVLNRQRSGLHAIAAETAAHTRRNNSARDEGRATQRSNR